MPEFLEDHLDRLLLGNDIDSPWYKSIGKSVREFINPPKLPPLEVTSRPLEGAELGELSAIEQPWFKSFISNVRDVIHPRKLPPLEVTSKPVEVGTIWGAYGGGETKSGTLSLLIHVAAITLLLVVFRKSILPPKPKDVTSIYFPIDPYKPKLPPSAVKSGGGGGGGQHAP